MILYLTGVSLTFLKECTPWYSWFKWLTCWAWTFVHVYFTYSFYLDLISRWHGNLSQVATTVAQALSELAFAFSLVVTVMFWLCVYPHQKWRNIWWEVNMHGAGLFLMIFDYLYRFAGEFSHLTYTLTRSRCRIQSAELILYLEPWRAIWVRIFVSR